MAKLVSTTYGEALYELSVEEGKVDQFWEEAGIIAEVIRTNPEFDTVMHHPKVALEEKVQLLQSVWKGRISDEMLGFLVLLAEKERYGELTSILDYFLTKIKKLKGIGVAKVTSAFALTDEQKASIEKKLLDTTEFKTMEMHYEYDPSIMGGIIIRIGDRVVDSSVRTKLYTLEKQLLQIQV